jgi:AraC-like DNA-binding protein
MTVHRKQTLLRHHAFTRLRLVHAAFVDSYECHIAGNRMPVNRLLFVCGDDRGEDSVIRDLSDGTLLPMTAGHLYFIPCNHMVDLNIAPELPFVSLQFNLDLFYGFDFFESHPRCEMLENPDLVAELRLLMERDAELRTLYRVNEIIFHLCVLWAPIAGPDIQERQVRSLKYKTATEFIRTSGSAATTVAMLADMTGMRRDVFSRTFTRDMGITPKAFISDSLVRKASEMLLAPGASVKVVAQALDFSSEYYFSHFFKRHTGMSPSAFRKHNGGR